jgi:hypothetical protein
MASEFPNTSFTGLDVQPMQRALVPRNVRVETCDVNVEGLRRYSDLDLVNARMIAMGKQCHMPLFTRSKAFFKASPITKGSLERSLVHFAQEGFSICKNGTSKWWTQTNVLSHLSKTVGSPNGVLRFALR